MMIRAKSWNRSRGLTVVAVLVCLIILTLISGAVLKVGVAQRELARAQERRLQAEWLAESGAQRAFARLARDHDYTGETWSLGAHDLGLRESVSSSASSPKSNLPAAIVAISVERVPSSSHRRHVKIVADYPPEAPRRSRHTKDIMIDLQPSQPGAAR